MPHPDVVAAERLGNEIAELSAHIEVAMARLLDKIREFDELAGWGNGFKSCAEWLSWRVGMDLSAAYERVRVARALPALPLISAAFARGEVSYSKARALTRVATPETEERLLQFARCGTAAHVERLARAWRRVDRNADNQEAQQRHKSRALYVYQGEDGMFVIRGRLTPEVGAVVRKALAAACDRMFVKPLAEPPGVIAPSIGQLQADALGMIAEAALHHDLDPGAPGERYQVVVHVFRGRIPADRVRCEPRDHDARCGRACSRGERSHPKGHHIRHWANGGPTTLSNLALLCRRHHRAVHQEGFQLERRADGELEFRHPYGWVLPQVPPRPDLAGDSEAILRAQNAGVQLDAGTLRPLWGGERLNLGWAIDVMHPRAIGR